MIVSGKKALVGSKRSLDRMSFGSFAGPKVFRSSMMAANFFHWAQKWICSQCRLLQWPNIVVHKPPSKDILHQLSLARHSSNAACCQTCCNNPVQTVLSSNKKHTSTCLTCRFTNLTFFLYSCKISSHHSSKVYYSCRTSNEVRQLHGSSFSERLRMACLVTTSARQRNTPLWETKASLSLKINMEEMEKL